MLQFTKVSGVIWGEVLLVANLLGLEAPGLCYSDYFVVSIEFSPILRREPD